jgi:putative tricarboxylic transport membrane protein
MTRTWQLCIAALFLALSGAYALGASGFPAETGYAGIGSRFVPTIVAIFLAAVGLLLAWQAMTGGFRNFTDSVAELAADWSGGLWVSAGIIAHALLITRIGFVLAACILFTCVARGFGSKKWWRDALIGAAIVLPVFWLFSMVLDVNLPRILNDWI